MLPIERVEAGRSVQSMRLDGVMVQRVDQGGGVVRTLDIESLTIPAGAKMGIAGASGAGKTTLLDVASGLLVPTSGRVAWGDLHLAHLSRAACDRWRRETVGFVFQDFHLVPELTVLDNILLPVWFGAFRTSPALRLKALDLIERLNLPGPRRFAGVLSRGEQQRVAIARALMLDAPLIIADEPTASLDAVNGADIADLLIAEASQRGATLLVATHDKDLLARLDGVVQMDAGRIRSAA